MSKKQRTFKAGEVVESRGGQFAKVIEVTKDNFVRFNGWHATKEKAAKAEVPNDYLNIDGMRRAVGDLEAITNPRESGGEGDTSKPVDDGLDGATVDELKAAAADTETDISGLKKKDDIIEALRAAGVVLTDD